MTEMVADWKIGAIALSDYAPVELVVKLKSSRSNGKRWRLNASLLQDPTSILGNFFIGMWGQQRGLKVGGKPIYIGGYLISQFGYMK